MKKIFGPILLMILGFSVVFMIYLSYLPDLETAPKLYYKDSLYMNVKKISYERNYLYLNDTLYDAGGISSYSKVHSNHMESTYLLRIKPPFRLEKSANNDTLRIIQKKKHYYLILTQEQRFMTDRNN